MYGSAPREAHPGDAIQLDMTFEPVKYTRGQTGGGSSFTSMVPLAEHTVRQMRLCTSTGAPCVPDGTWSPYARTVQLKLQVDWLGDAQVRVGAEFRDDKGAAVRVVSSGAEGAVEVGSYGFTVASALDQSTPLGNLPPRIQTAAAATRSAFPVTGSVQINNGGCCAGGKVGSTISLTLEFKASSAAAPVKEMRTRNACVPPAEMNDAAWEPFVTGKIFPVTITVPNWIGWYIAVQYRDAQGNLSPVYCDDISVEGMP